MSDLRVAKEFLQQHLPKDLMRVLDLNGLEICKDKFHHVNLKSKITDMLYRAPLKEDSTTFSYIAVLVEHQSTPQKTMPLRVLSYETAIMHQHMERYGVVSLVYSIVFYNGRLPWNYSCDIKDLIQAPQELIEHYALQPFQLVDLNQISDLELRRNQWVGVMSLAMKHVYDRDILPALREMMDLLKIVEKQRGGDLVLSLLYYLHERGEVSNLQELHKLVASELPTEGGRAMTIAEMLRQEGRQEGRLEGLQTGEHNKSLTIARNLLRKGVNPMLVAEATGLEMVTINEMMEVLEKA